MEMEGKVRHLWMGMALGTTAAVAVVHLLENAIALSVVNAFMAIIGL